jgi:hypothetical protein
MELKQKLQDIIVSEGLVSQKFGNSKTSRNVRDVDDMLPYEESPKARKQLQTNFSLPAINTKFKGQVDHYGVMKSQKEMKRMTSCSLDIRKGTSTTQRRADNYSSYKDMPS